MDEETASAFAVEEFEKVLSEFDMQDFAPEAGQSQQTEVPETNTSTSPEKTSPDLTVVDDFVLVPASVADADDMVEKETISDLAVSAFAPSLTSAADPHSTHTALETERAHAGESLSGSAVQSTSISDSDGTYMIPDADWVTGRGRIGTVQLN